MLRQVNDFTDQGEALKEHHNILTPFMKNQNEYL